MNGRVAVVTGAASGIGRAIADRFADERASVALLDQDADGGRAAADQLRSRGSNCEFFRADVTSAEEVRETITAVLQKFGSIDHLVNSAGINLVKGIEDCTAEEFDRILAVNVRSVFLLSKYCLPYLRRSAYATIVNIASISSFVGQKGTPAYVASKGAVLMLSKALALDLAEYGIRVNCVCPGITDTPMLRSHLNSTPDPDRTLAERCARVPLGRMLDPHEVAAAVLYLSSERASGITGTELVVDAGYTAAAEWSKS